jgi:hypothetical protein
MLIKSKKSMLDNKPRSGESSKSRNGGLRRRSALKTRRGGKRRRLREHPSLRKEGKGDLPEGLRIRHSLRRQAMCRWAVRAQEADQEARALELGGPRVVLVRASRLVEDEEQELDVWHQCIFHDIPRPQRPFNSASFLQRR